MNYLSYLNRYIRINKMIGIYNSEFCILFTYICVQQSTIIISYTYNKLKLFAYNILKVK